TGASINRADASQAWRHNWTSTVSSGVLGGGIVVGDAIAGYSLSSVAQVDLLYDNYGRVFLEPGAPPEGAPPGRGNRLQVGIVAKAQPWIDLFSGELEQRAVGSVAAADTFDRFTVRGQFSAGRVFN